MLEKARERVARKGVRNAWLLQMDAANLKFADDTFDIVYAPHVISVVPDPVAVDARDAPRLPPRRTHRRPQPLPQPESGDGFNRTGHLRRSPSTSASSPISICPASWPRPNLKPLSIEKVNVPGSGRSSRAPKISRWSLVVSHWSLGIDQRLTTIDQRPKTNDTTTND